MPALGLRHEAGAVETVARLVDAVGYDALQRAQAHPLTCGCIPCRVVRRLGPGLKPCGLAAMIASAEGVIVDVDAAVESQAWHAYVTKHEARTRLLDAVRAGGKRTRVTTKRGLGAAGRQEATASGKQHATLVPSAP